jgi:hypothetical protein
MNFNVCRDQIYALNSVRSHIRTLDHENLGPLLEMEVLQANEHSVGLPND